MNAFIFVAATDAQSTQSDCDTRLGYPKPGVDIGGGVHVPPAQSSTVHEAPVLKHRTLTQWAFLSTPNVQAILPTVKADLPAVTIGTATALDATWNDATPADSVVVAAALPAAQDSTSGA